LVMLFFKTSIVSFILACFFCFVAGSPLPDTNAARLARGLPPAAPKFGRYLPGKRGTATTPPSAGTSPVPPGTCDETAYGYVPGKSKTFISLGIGRNWGWVIQGNTPITGTLYAGAGGNDLSKGTIVGSFSIQRAGSNLVVTYNVNAPFTLSETHFFYGTTYPSSIAPGQFGNTHSLPSGTTTDTFTIPFDAAKKTYIVHAAISC